jgi:hypothetical protein
MRQRPAMPSALLMQQAEPATSSALQLETLQMMAMLPA